MRRDLKVRFALALPLALMASVASWPLSALAGTVAVDGNGSISNGTITATAGSSVTGSMGSNGEVLGSSVGASSGQAAQSPQCYYAPAPPNLAASLGPGPGGPGSWYSWYCTLPTLSITDARPTIWVPAGPASSASAAATPSVPALIQQAIDQANLVDPTINLNPPGDQVVNIASWLWINPSDWGDVVASAAAGGVSTTVVAAPTSVIWNLGNGSSIDCPGPGVAYNPDKLDSEQSTYCQYTWTVSSAGQPGGVYQVTATIEYDVTTSVTGAPDPTPDLGMHFGPTSSVEVPVSEIEALGTSP